MPRSCTSSHSIHVFMPKDKDWFRIRRYPHIGLPLEYKDRSWLTAYVRNKDKIRQHSFLPFIHRKYETRRFRREICHDGTRSNLRKPSKKPRDLYYSSHIDSNIYGYYADKISKCYSIKLDEYGLSDCVTAYRRIKLNPLSQKSRHKCNIDFANEVFEFIRESKETKLITMSFDIKSFFDTLNHAYLKKQWKNVIKSNSDLPDDHYTIFRNITKFSYVEENELFNTYKDKILVSRQPSTIKAKTIDKKKYLKGQRAIAFCYADELRVIRKKGLIKSNKHEYDATSKKKLGLRKIGIPQGASISSVLANIYMIEFDKSIFDFINSRNGFYRRYSDDMIIVCKPKFKQDIIDKFSEEINKCKLKLQTSKTQIFEFNFDAKKGRYFCYEHNTNTNRKQTNTKFEYLGFQFDGKNVYLRSSSLARYYRKMKKAIARGFFFSLHNKTSTKGKVFKSRLYKRFTFVGAQRRRIYKRDNIKSDIFTVTNKYDWGNFITYANLAARTIRGNKIMKQVGNHWRKFHTLLKR